MGERRQLVQLVRRGLPVVEAAAMFGVSRKTAHKWLSRADADGEAGLVDLSRARRNIDRFDGPAAELLVALRRRHMEWGPRTLLDHLATIRPKLELPAASTVGELLKREGLVTPRKQRVPKGIPPYQVGESQPKRPNDRWTTDFKGEFRLGNGQLCYPLTLRDAVSRKILDVHALPSTEGEAVKQRFEWAFREYGLPTEMHSDNGTPFATYGLARLSFLSVYLLKLGIRPLLSRPGRPQDNGGHERMHRDLKAATTRPPADSFAGQQKRFDHFRAFFNGERPHRALQGRTPDATWRPSPREYPRRLQEPEYPAHWETRRVDRRGHTLWRGLELTVSKALARESIGLEPIADGVWRVHFAALAIGVLDERVSPQKVLGLRPASAKHLPPTEKAA